MIATINELLLNPVYRHKYVVFTLESLCVKNMAHHYEVKANVGLKKLT